ncbi:hypothetical protein BBAL3_971 [Brevundimonas sp. BAL3]|nr:hypothetical protein BBAL3_971 [Brevundimonas sp. BAL3]
MACSNPVRIADARKPPRHAHVRAPRAASLPKSAECPARLPSLRTPRYAQRFRTPPDIAGMECCIAQGVSEICRGALAEARKPGLGFANGTDPAMELRIKSNVICSGASPARGSGGILLG